MQFIDLKSQYNSLKAKIDQRIQNVLDHGKYIMGPEVQELEGKLADYVGVKHAITCANGTDALQLALMALGIGNGDAVLCPTFTFFATAEAIAFVGAEPIFVDIEAESYNICPEKLEREIQKSIEQGKKIKAVISVDLFGLPADYEKLESLCSKYDLKLIEDAAQGFGGTTNGRKAGSFGDIATTSFFPAKPLGCYGDGGALFTNDDELAELLKSFRVHGKGTDKYDNIRIGMNSRLDTIQAAILLEKLAVFPDELESRQKTADRYSEALNDKFITPYVDANFTSSWAQYSILASSAEARSQAMQDLKEKGVPSVVYYAKCLHLQTAFKNLSYKEGDFPISEEMSQRIFSLPMSGYVTLEDVLEVNRALLETV